MISRELARKIRYIQIFTNRAVNSTLGGEYESVFKGQGMEFDEVREYQRGDDVRSIDWNVTARTGVPHVKRFVEERELVVIFLVDLSSSGMFGSTDKTKNEVAAEVCALMAFSAIRNNDKVGLIVFTGEVEFFIPPNKGTRHVLRLIEELLSFRPRGEGTSIATALDYLGRVTTKKGVVFLVSDFIDSGFEQQMKVASRRHDLVAVTVRDPREVILPDIGMVRVRDAESGRIAVIDTGSTAIRRRYRETMEKRQEALRKLFASAGIDQIEIQTDRDYLDSIVTFFLRRERRLKV
jgi:uncharacterized protein (DUF58 family)